MFTHILNPFRANANSGHELAQRLTFAGISSAVEEAHCQGVQVEVLGIAFPEDADDIPDPVVPVPALRRSIAEVAPGLTNRRYSILADVLLAAANYATQGYVIFSNMDIVPQPYFYCILKKLLTGRSPRYLIINRRNVDVQEINSAMPDSLYRPLGRGHEGWDCFVFPAAWLRMLDVGTVFIGVPFFDNALGVHLDVLSGHRGIILGRQMLTVHVGDDKGWKGQHELIAWNRRQFLELERRLRGSRPAWPRGSIAELMVSRSTERVDAKSLLHQRLFSRLRIDNEALLWRKIERTRARYGLPRYPDPQPGPWEYLSRKLRYLLPKGRVLESVK